MRIPSKIRINREAGYHADVAGKFADGQYLGFVLFLEPGQKRLVSVLHQFDRAGKHVSSEAWDDAPEASLKAAVARLAKAKPGNISVRPFAVDLLGVKFGLIPREDGECLEYLPYGLAFFPPWDGTYDT